MVGSSTLADIEFLNSTSLGESDYNNVFVGDYNNGNLYYFEVNANRSGFILDNIPDLVVDNEEEQKSIIFGSGFGSITDIVTGPDDGFCTYYHMQMELFTGLHLLKESNTSKHIHTFSDVRLGC